MIFIHFIRGNISFELIIPTFLDFRVKNEINICILLIFFISENDET